MPAGQARPCKRDPRLDGSRRRLDERDDVVDVGERDGQSFEDVGPVAGPREIVNGAASDDFAPMADERLEHVLERHELRLAVLQGHHVHAEHRFHRRLREEIIEHDLGDFAALELDDQPHAVLVGLIADLGDAVDELAPHQVGDALGEARLVDLERQLGDDDGLALALADVFEVRARPDGQAAAARAVGRCDLLRAIDDAGGREIGARNVLHQAGERQRRIVQQRDAAVDDFSEIVRRDVGRHAHRDARLSIDEQIRHARRQHRRLGLRLVVVGGEIDRSLFDVREQLVRDPRHAHFGVAHCRRRIAVHRTEIALAVDEHVAHRKRLRHAHHRVVHGGVAVRMVFADHVADDTSGLLVGLVVVVAELTHCIEHTAMHGLQTVTYVGQRTPDDHAHRVVEIRLPHLVFEIDGGDFAGGFSHL